MAVPYKQDDTLLQFLHHYKAHSSTFCCWGSFASLDVKAPSGEGGNV